MWVVCMIHKISLELELTSFSLFLSFFFLTRDAKDFCYLGWNRGQLKRLMISSVSWAPQHQWQWTQQYKLYISAHLLRQVCCKDCLWRKKTRNCSLEIHQPLWLYSAPALPKRRMEKKINNFSPAIVTARYQLKGSMHSLSVFGTTKSQSITSPLIQKLIGCVIFHVNFNSLLISTVRNWNATTDGHQ